MSTLVSSLKFGKKKFNGDKFKILDDLLKICMDDVSLLVLPAGFFYATTDDEFDVIINMICEKSNETGVSIVGGIDMGIKVIRSKINRKRLYRLTKQNQLPFFAFYITPNAKPNMWRQSSTNNEDANIENIKFNASDRIVSLKDKSSDEILFLAVLICGELFSENSREVIGDESPDLTIDLGHSRMGNGLIPAMKNIARKSNSPVMHAQHVINISNASLHCVDSAIEHIKPKEGTWLNDTTYVKYTVWKTLKVKPKIRVFDK